MHQWRERAPAEEHIFVSEEPEHQRRESVPAKAQKFVSPAYATAQNPGPMVDCSRKARRPAGHGLASGRAHREMSAGALGLGPAADCLYTEKSLVCKAVP